MAIAARRALTKPAPSNPGSRNPLVRLSFPRCGPGYSEVVIPGTNRPDVNADSRGCPHIPYVVLSVRRSADRPFSVEGSAVGEDQVIYEAGPSGAGADGPQSAR